MLKLIGPRDLVQGNIIELGSLKNNLQIVEYKKNQYGEIEKKKIRDIDILELQDDWPSLSPDDKKKSLCEWCTKNNEFPEFLSRDVIE